MQIAREEPFGSLQKEADTFCLKFTLNSLILSWIKMRHFLGFINSVYDSWHIRKMHENLMKNTNRKVVDHVFKNTLKCAADKNKETKAAPKLRRQARWVYNPRKNSKWVENGLTADCKAEKKLSLLSNCHGENHQAHMATSTWIVALSV